MTLLLSSKGEHISFPTPLHYFRVRNLEAECGDRKHNAITCVSVPIGSLCINNRKYIRAAVYVTHCVTETDSEGWNVPQYHATSVFDLLQSGAGKTADKK